jgi:ribonuclease HII
MKPCNLLGPSPDSSYPADTFHFECSLYSQGYASVAGIDEAGRGPLAGPVVAACVILPQSCDYRLFKDSKQLTARRRDVLFDILQTNGALIGVGFAGPREIEQINILQASLLAMKRATEDCAGRNNGCPPEYLLVDGTFQVPTPICQRTLVKGESKSASIAAASIVAKVTRDRFMAESHRQYPQYGFLRHQGYPTKEHRLAISRYGPCPLHRRTYRGVMEFLDSNDSTLVPVPDSL